MLWFDGRHDSQRSARHDVAAAGAFRALVCDARLGAGRLYALAASRCLRD
jgi:hypothetical protein